MRSRLFVTLLLLTFVPSILAAATTDEQVRKTFGQFVTAQNAHDAKAVEGLLLDSPSFLWITRGNAIWGRSAAIDKFEALYKGTWHLEPEMDAMKITELSKEAAQIYVPIVFTIGAEGQASIDTRFLMNMVLRKSGKSWKVASILPIPAAPPAPPQK